jgi:hypothetical protein
MSAGFQCRCWRNALGLLRDSALRLPRYRGLSRNNLGNSVPTGPTGRQIQAQGFYVGHRCQPSSSVSGGWVRLLR